MTETCPLCMAEKDINTEKNEYQTVKNGKLVIITEYRCSRCHYVYTKSERDA